MSRRRYISTDISTDPKIAELAEFGALPLLLYTWAIPHMDDWGRMIGDARQFKLLVCPAMDVTSAQIEEALHQIASVGLWIRYEDQGRKYIAIPPESWFKHQTYINKSKREEDKSQIPSPLNSEQHRRTPQNTAEHRESTHNTVSPSPSPTNNSPSAREDDIETFSHHAFDDPIKNQIHILCNEYQLAGISFFTLDGLFAYIGKVDIEVFEYAIKKANSKKSRHINYAIGVVEGLAKEGRTTKESLFDIEIGESPRRERPGKTINGRPDLVIATDEERRFLDDVRRGQAERNQTALGP